MSVRVHTLLDGRVFLVVAERGVHVTTAAAKAALDAIDELLLREGQQLARHSCVGTLKSTSGGEGPAGAAMPLILDVGDIAVLAPVDG